MSTITRNTTSKHMKEDGDQHKCKECENKFKNDFQVRNHFTKYHTTKKCGETVTSGVFARYK